VRGRIVLADDEADLRRLLKARLTRSGFEVLDVEDGKLALALVRAVRPDLVLLDHRMPEMDGGEACRQIKADPDLSVTPVVIVTATSKAMDPDIAAAFRPDDIVIKPFTYSDLLSRIERLLPSVPEP